VHPVPPQDIPRERKYWRYCIDCWMIHRHDMILEAARKCDYQGMLVTGLARKEISGRLGLSREHVSRMYGKKALELVTEEFLATAMNNR